MSMSERNQQDEWKIVDEVSSEFFELIPKDFNYKNRDRKTLYNWLKTSLESTLQDQKHSLLSTLKSEVERIKLPVPNPYGKWVKVENVNKILQQVINLIEKHQNEG